MCIRDRAEILCDRVAVMRKGRIVGEGTPQELIDRHGPGVRVRFPALDADIEWLREIPGLTSAAVLRGEAEVTGGATIVAELGAVLIGRSRGPIPMRVDQPDLEAALLSLIGQNNSTGEPS